MSIATRLEAIEQHITDDYSVLTLAGADLTNVNKNIVNLKPTWKERLLYFMNNGTDTVWNNWDKVNGSGTSITLNNTEYAPMKLEYLGNTSQDSTTGVNLLAYPYKDTTASPKDNNGVIWTDLGDGRIKANGTPTAISTFDFYTQTSPLTVKPSTTYTLGIISTNINLRFSFSEYDSNNTLIASHDNVSIKTFTTSATTTKLVGGIKRYVNNTSINNVIVEPMLVEGTYTSSNFPAYEKYTGGIPSPNPSYPQDVHVVSGDNTITIKNGDNTQSQSYHITLPSGTELCKIGTYQDLIFKNIPSSTHYDNTLDEGDWYLKKEIGKYVFTGSENYSTWTNNRVIVSNTPNDYLKAESNYVIPKVLCSNYVIVTRINNSSVNNSLTFYSATDGSVGTIVNDSTHNTNTLLSNYFSQQYQANTPVIICYVLSTPTYTKITGTLEEQLEAIKRSYEEQTNISQTNTDLPFELSVSALEEMN